MTSVIPTLKRILTLQELLNKIAVIFNETRSFLKCELYWEDTADILLNWREVS